MIFDFEVGISCEEPQAKRWKVQLEKEESKNEVTYATLKEMLISKRILRLWGISTNAYSVSVNRHQLFFTVGIISSLFQYRLAKVTKQSYYYRRDET